MNALSETTADRFWPTRHYRPYWYVVALFVVLALTAADFDVFIAKTANFEKMRGDAVRVLKLSELFAHGFGIAVVLVGIWLMIPDKRKYLPRLMVCALLPGLLVHGVKILIGRIRPIEYQNEYPAAIADSWLGFLPGEGLGLNLEYATQAFPSAHTATAVSFAIGLSWLFPRGRNLFIALALLASLQRVVFEAHWLSDVFAGAAIGVMVGSSMTLNWGFGYWCGLFEHRGRVRFELSEPTSESLNRRKSA